MGKGQFFEKKNFGKKSTKMAGMRKIFVKKIKISVFKPLWVSHIIYIPGEKIGHMVVHPTDPPPYGLKLYVNSYCILTKTLMIYFGQKYCLGSM